MTEIKAESDALEMWFCWAQHRAGAGMEQKLNGKDFGLFGGGQKVIVRIKEHGLWREKIIANTF